MHTTLLLSHKNSSCSFAQNGYPSHHPRRGGFHLQARQRKGQVGTSRQHARGKHFINFEFVNLDFNLILFSQYLHSFLNNRLSRTWAMPENVASRASGRTSFQRGSFPTFRVPTEAVSKSAPGTADAFSYRQTQPTFTEPCTPNCVPATPDSQMASFARVQMRFVSIRLFESGHNIHIAH